MWYDSMVKPQHLGKNVRMSFAKNEEVLEMPNLIEIQKKSFERSEERRVGERV